MGGSDAAAGRPEVSPHGTSLFVRRLREPEPLVTVELRPPRSGLGAGEGMEAWIDTNQAIRRLIRRDRFVFLTDNAVGAAEEENLAHVTANLAGEVDLRRVVPFLTCKHTLEYCVRYAGRAAATGVEALTVLGGDRNVGPPRCVPHAHQLRALLAGRVPALTLGGWANPHRDPEEQVGFLAADDFHAEFFLTQVVSHHTADRAAALLEEMDRRGLDLPGVFGVFYYRSANPRTLSRLGEFFPVPAREITREMEDEGASAEEVCARTIRALRKVGARRIYVSNLGLGRAAETLDRILERV